MMQMGIEVKRKIGRSKSRWNTAKTGLRENR